MEAAVHIFVEVFRAIAVIFGVAFVSGLLVRQKVISQQQIDALSHITVVILLPCLMFAKILNYFDPSVFPYWWIMPLSALGMIGLALAFGKLLYFRSFKSRKNYIAISAFMNANYLILPIGQMVFKEEFNLFATYCFLFILGVNPTLWSLGKYMVTDDVNKGVKGLLTPPFLASVSAIFLVLLGLRRLIPEVVMEPIAFMGEAAIPIATFVLGATLGSIAIRSIPSWFDILRILGVKLLLIPATVLVVMLQIPLLRQHPLIADLLILQASSAPATQLIIQIRKYGGDVQNVGSLMLWSYTACIVTMPFWITLWRWLAQ